MSDRYIRATNIYQVRVKPRRLGRAWATHHPQECKLEQTNSRVFLPKIGWLGYRNSREALGAVSNITVSANGGKWFVSIQIEHVRPTAMRIMPIWSAR